MSIEQTDAESRAVAKNDNRISLEFIESQIASCLYTTGAQATLTARGYDVRYNHPIDEPENTKLGTHLSALTICILVIRNGFIVIGKSAPMDPLNFNEDLGRKFAYEDAVRQLWPLFAFSRLDHPKA